jgi:hypothetical protein
MPDITCVVKDDKNNITHVGIPTLITEQDAIKRVTNGEEFYVVRPGTPKVKVGVRPKTKPEYLVTDSDGERLNNLTNLRRCY